MSDEKFTREKYEKHIKDLSEAMKPAPDILGFLHKHFPEATTDRFPIGLIMKAKPDEKIIIVRSPDVVIRPTHLVVSEETAETFDLMDIMITNVCTNVGFDVAKKEQADIPLETFSVKYMSDRDRAIWAVTALRAPAATPANRLSVIVHNRTKKDAEFRGILWCDASIVY